MIKVLLYEGEIIGNPLEMPINASSIKYLGGLFARKIRWEVDYSEATDKEQLKWMRADITIRIIRALSEKRPVIFNEVCYIAVNNGDINEIAYNIAEIMKQYGEPVTFGEDDEQGLRIITD